MRVTPAITTRVALVKPVPDTVTTVATESSPKLFGDTCVTVNGSTVVLNVATNSGTALPTLVATVVAVPLMVPVQPVKIAPVDGVSVTPNGEP